MNRYKNFNIRIARAYGRMPIIGRFYNKMADNMEADFWRVWRRWMVISVVCNGGLYLYSRHQDRKLDDEMEYFTNSPTYQQILADLAKPFR